MKTGASILEGLLATASYRDAAAKAELQQKIQELPPGEQGLLWRTVFEQLKTTVLQVMAEETPEKECLPLVAVCRAAASAGIVWDTLVTIVELLNGVSDLLEEGELLNSIHALCIVWCMKKLSRWKQLWLNAFTRVVQQSLKQLPKVTTEQLVATVLIMMNGLNSDSLDAVELDRDQRKVLYEQLAKCAVSANYLDRPKGRKVVTFFLTVDKKLAHAIYKEVDGALPSMTSVFIQVLAQIYLSAWKAVAGTEQATALEEDMQEVMYWYVNGDLEEAHHEKLFKFLKVLHAARKERAVAVMLCRCYLPILWRALKARHFRVRRNAAKIFFDSFPLLESTLAAQQQDELVTHFQTMHSLLADQCPEVRVLAVKGIFRVLTDFFEMIPIYERKELAEDLISKNALDMNCVESRVQVNKGLEYMIRSPMTHNLLKALIVKNKDSLEDIYSVQLSYVSLLLKARQIPGFKFWDAANPDELLPLMAEGKLELSLKVATLLRNSYFNPEGDHGTNCDRCVLLHSLNSAAFRVFYGCLTDIAPLLPIIKFLIAICQALRRNCLLLRKRAAATKENFAPDQCSSCELSGVPVDSSKRLIEQSSVHVLIEAVAITYNSVSLRNELASNELKTDWKVLVALMKITMNEMLQIADSLSMQISVLSAACLLPPDEVHNLAMRCLSMLRGFLTVPETSAPLALSMEAKACALFLCNMHRAADVLGMVADSVEKLKKKQTPVKGRRVQFCVEPKSCNSQLALQVLRYLLESPQLQIMVLKGHLVPLFNTWSALLCIADSLRDLLRNSNSKMLIESAMMTAYDLFLLLTYVLHGQQHPVTGEEFVATATFHRQMKWIEDNLLPKLQSKSRRSCRDLYIQVVKMFLKVARSVLMTTWVSFQFAEKLLNFVVLCKETKEDQLKTAIASIPPVVRQFMEIFAKGEEQAAIITAVMDKVCFEVPSVKSSDHESLIRSKGASKMDATSGEDTAAASECLRPDRESRIRSRRTLDMDTATGEDTAAASKCLRPDRESYIRSRRASNIDTITGENTAAASKCLRPDRESHSRSRRTSNIDTATGSEMEVASKCLCPDRKSKICLRGTSRTGHSH
ncbi:condensin-2 complex subunit G2-like isoform X2 [Amblyomma americanum]